MIEYNLNYKDNGENQWLTIKIDVEDAFNNPEFDFNDHEAKEVYELLISDNKDEIQEYLEYLTQEDDAPYRRGE